MNKTTETKYLWAVFDEIGQDLKWYRGRNLRTGGRSWKIERHKLIRLIPGIRERLHDEWVEERRMTEAAERRQKALAKKQAIERTARFGRQDIAKDAMLYRVAALTLRDQIRKIAGYQPRPVVEDPDGT